MLEVKGSIRIYEIIRENINRNMRTSCLYLKIFLILEMITVTDSQMTADITKTSHYYEKIL